MLLWLYQSHITRSSVNRLTTLMKQAYNYCIQIWIRPFLPYRDLRLIRPILNSPTLQFSYIISNSFSPVLNSLTELRVKGAVIKRGEILPVYSTLTSLNEFFFFVIFFVVFFFCHRLLYHTYFTKQKWNFFIQSILWSLVHHFPEFDTKTQKKRHFSRSIWLMIHDLHFVLISTCL